MKDPDDIKIPESTNIRHNPKPRKKLKYDGKEINNWRQLTFEDKGIVKLVFMEGTIKGYKFYQILQYIFAVTGIRLHKKFAWSIKRQHEEDNLRWYYNLARDRFAYVSLYRKAIDEIELYKEQLWKILIKPTASDIAKVAAVKELHNLSKTSVLFLKDLPFVMNLSQHYDPDLLDPAHNSLYQLGRTRVRDPNTKQADKPSFLNVERTDPIEKHHTNLVFSTLERIGSKHTMNDELTKLLKEQTEGTGDPNDIPLPIETEGDPFASEDVENEDNNEM